MTTVLKKKTDSARYARLGSKATGASHVIDNTCCQDNFTAWPMTSAPSPTAVVAVGDGHGSKLHGRSHVGSFLAVESGTEVLGFYARQLSDKRVTARLHEFWTQKITKLIYEKWYRRVLRHYETNPFQASDFYELNDKQKESLNRRPEIAYGTTLLSATITTHALALVRIGDGLIVVCDDEGNVSLPFNEQDELDETSPSLCTRDAVSHFQVELIPIEDTAPAMVLCTTDGYHKDCGKIENFLPFVKTLHEFATTHTLVELSDTVEASLEHRAKTAADDLTFGLLVRSDIVEAG